MAKKKQIRILSDLDASVQILTDGKTIVECRNFTYWSPDDLLNLHDVFVSWCHEADQGTEGFRYLKA